MQACILQAVLLKSIVPYIWLLQAAFVFFLIVVSILLFVALYLYYNRRQQRKKSALRLLFADLIAQTILCESEDERRAALHDFLAGNMGLIQASFPRRLLIRELVRTRANISGSAAENIRWLFETLDLDRDTLQRFSSTQWHRKASAIQHLAALQQSRHLIKIYRETNNRNSWIRNEAQLAVVKLTGFKGLRFLNIVSYPISRWQQLALINQLPEGDIEEKSIGHWLRSTNETVVEFALRLVVVNKCFELQKAVACCLQHTSASVRLQALQALKEINNSTTTTLLITHFKNAGREEQLAVLDLLPQLDAGSQELPFLTTLLQHEDEAIRYRAVRLIQQISPAWSSVVIRQVKDNPSFTYILSSLNKQVV